MTKEERAQRDRLNTIAHEWIGTPFHDHAEVKGAGCDCATFLKCAAIEAGLVEPFELDHYSPQFFLHQKEERYIGWVTKFAREIAQDEATIGDIVLYKVGHVFAHGAMIVAPGWPTIIHAHFGARRVRRGDGLNPMLGTRRTRALDMKFFSLWRV